jgi:hypothetical protein
MKRFAILTLAIAVMLIGSYTAVSAQTPTKQTPPAGQRTVGPNFVDANGDGICDNFQNGTCPNCNRGAGKRGGGYGPGDGTGHRGMGPKDGTGFGPGASAGPGSGTCDGTGPKGMGRGRGPRR